MITAEEYFGYAQLARMRLYTAMACSSEKLKELFLDQAVNYMILARGK